MEKYDVRDIFTPTKPAKITFVERFDINDRLVDALHTPGKQIVVYGHSGSGKTTLLVNKLNQIYENSITTRCVTGLTFEQLVLDAFDQLAPFFELDITESRNTGVTSSISIEYLGIKSKIDLADSKHSQVRKQRMLPPQLTPQRLAKFLGESNCCWVLEDFHKIQKEEKTKLAQVMKIFMDMAYDYNDLKIIAIGAVGTAREVVQYDAEMKNRVAEISVPLMNEKELTQILNKGEKALNIIFSKNLNNAIAKYSNGLASICHQLALNICFSHGIYASHNKSRKFESSALHDALTKYIENESDTIKSAFEKALRKQRKQKFDNSRLILKSLTEFEFDEGAIRAQLMDKIRKEEPDYPEGNLTFYLNNLQSEENGRIVRHDGSSGKYLYSNPFHRVFALALFAIESREKPFAEVKMDTKEILMELNKLIEETTKRFEIHYGK